MIVATATPMTATMSRKPIRTTAERRAAKEAELAKIQAAAANESTSLERERLGELDGPAAKDDEAKRIRRAILIYDLRRSGTPEQIARSLMDAWGRHTLSDLTRDERMMLVEVLDIEPRLWKLLADRKPVCQCRRLASVIARWSVRPLVEDLRIVEGEWMCPTCAQLIDGQPNVLITRLAP